MLDRHVLKYGLDYRVHRADIPVLGGAADAPQEPLHLLRAEATALHRGLVVFTHQGQAALQRLLPGLHQYYRDARLGEIHGDAAAHGAGTDHGDPVYRPGRCIGGDTGDFGGGPLGEKNMPQGGGLG